MIKKLYLYILVLIFSFGKVCFSASETTRSNCPYEKASIYFTSPSVITSEYSPDYYCSDIVYLEKNQKGNITLSEYKSLYPVLLQANFNYLRQVGITPDIIENYIDEESYPLLLTKDGVNSYIQSGISQARINNNYYIVSYREFEDNPDIFEEYSVGSIVNKDKRYKACSTIKEEKYEISTDSIYSDTTPSYKKIISALPPALAPIVIDGNNLLNMFGMVVGKIYDNRALGSSTREITFSSDIINRPLVANIDWNEKVCKANTLQEIANRNSTCYLCPYILIVFNEISYLFEYMYTNFRSIILEFLVVFGALFLLYEFLKGFKGIPFTSDFSDYPKSISKTLKAIFIVSAVILVPPKYLFSWTIEPVIDLTIAVSDSIIQVGNTENSEFTCNSSQIVDELNNKRRAEQNDQIIPPVSKLNQVKAFEQLQDSIVISKETMGNIICFLTNTLQANGKQMTMGEVLMKDLFNSQSQSEHKFLGFIFGFIIFMLYFLISLMISFYILDGLLEFLKLAILWPFYVFGYVFPFIGFNVKNIINIAKNFGLTMVNLAVFSMFNSALLNAFYFGTSKENIMQQLNRAIAENDTSIITNNIPYDLLSITKFLFIIYCIYYIYAKLDTLASSYGGSMGKMTIGKNIKNLFTSSMKLTASREEDKNLQKEDNKLANKTESKEDKNEK